MQTANFALRRSRRRVSVTARQLGMTLIEIMVVVVIIGVLAALTAVRHPAHHVGAVRGHVIERPAELAVDPAV